MHTHKGAELRLQAASFLSASECSTLQTTKLAFNVVFLNVINYGRMVVTLLLKGKLCCNNNSQIKPAFVRNVFKVAIHETEIKIDIVFAFFMLV